MGYGSSVAVSCGVGYRCSSDLALLWLWQRSAAIAPVQPLAWEPSYAMCVALKNKQTKICSWSCHCGSGCCYSPSVGTFICCGCGPKKTKKGVPVVAQGKQIRLGTMRLQVRSLASLSGLRIRHCHELWCMSQKQFGSCIAMAMA